MGFNIWPQQKHQQIIFVSSIALIILYIIFGTGIWAGIFAILIGLLLGAWNMVGKGQSLKFIVLFYGAIWIFLKIVNSGGRRDATIAFLSLVCLFTIIGAVITYFILKSKGMEVVNLSQQKNERPIVFEMKGKKPKTSKKAKTRK